MIILDYQKKYHKKIIHACVLALKQGKVVAYPTDTSYGLAVDATNVKAVNKLYKVKERDFKKAVSIVTPSPAYSKKIARWDKVSSQLAKKFWPGPLTLAIELKVESKKLKVLCAGTNFLAIRLPDNIIALDLAHQLGNPITATSANPSLHLSGGYDSYSAQDIVSQFKNKKFQPDIIIDAGKLPKRKPSTLVKIDGAKIQILRQGPISQNQILKTIK